MAISKYKCTICRCHGVFALVLRLFCFASFFRLYAFVGGPSFNHPLICRRSDSDTCFFLLLLFFSFLYLEMSLFPSIFPAFSLYGEYLVRSFLPDGVFSTL